MVDQIKRAITIVRNDSDPGDRDITITGAALTLNVVVTNDVGGNLRFRLFGHDLGGGVTLSSADTQTIQLDLTPVTSDEVEFLGDGENVSVKLVSAMRAIRASVQRASAAKPRFGLDQASVELNFQVDKDGTIDFIVAGSAKKTNVQTVKLVLARAGG